MATSKDVTYRGQWFDALAEESSSRLRGKFSEGCNLTGVHAWARHVVQDCRRSPEFLKVGTREAAAWYGSGQSFVFHLQL